VVHGAGGAGHARENEQMDPTTVNLLGLDPPIDSILFIDIHILFFSLRGQLP
jgi:hypothetical protein